MNKTPEWHCAHLGWAPLGRLLANRTLFYFFISVWFACSLSVTCSQGCHANRLSPELGRAAAPVSRASIIKGCRHPSDGRHRTGSPALWRFLRISAHTKMIPSHTTALEEPPFTCRLPDYHRHASCACWNHAGRRAFARREPFQENRARHVLRYKHFRLNRHA